MNTATYQLANIVQRHRVQLFTPMRSLLFGAGMAWAIEKEKYWHLPIAFFFPSAYAGYHGYQNRETIKNFLRLQ